MTESNGGFRESRVRKLRSKVAVCLFRLAEGCYHTINIRYPVTESDAKRRRWLLHRLGSAIGGVGIWVSPSARSIDTDSEQGAP